MLLVYTSQITPRVKYIFKHFFDSILRIPVTFTTEVSVFVAHNGPKMTYARAPLGTEFFIRSHELLFSQGVNDVDISITPWEEVPCFFPAGEQSSIPFDVFAASFYLISRYEEYLPHVKDTHGRFPAQESLAYKHDFLELPVIDLWAYKFLDLLRKKFPDYPYEQRSFRMIATFDIDQAYAYKYKGVVRTIGGFISDLFRLQLLNFWHRLRTLLNMKQDPFDTYAYILKQAQKHRIDTLFFVLVADYTTFDKNISSANSRFRSLIKSLADYVKVGLHPSYFTMKNEELLKKEKGRLEQIINTPVLSSRQHFLRLAIPETYQYLLELGIEEDHSMGYVDRVGFRAGTCTPFHFYNLDYEIQTPLKVYPFALMDVSLKHFMALNNQQALKKILALKAAVKAVNGTFISLFHNETLSETAPWIGWRKIYQKMIA
ncbi:MAG: polysaccharide deacetylase family protein [Lutibacter sp.]|jgi:hypothetical protein|nr:polysaccharide deacetylase family protein [Lutibacter sp.]